MSVCSELESSRDAEVGVAGVVIVSPDGGSVASGWSGRWESDVNCEVKITIERLGSSCQNVIFITKLNGSPHDFNMNSLDGDWG